LINQHRYRRGLAAVSVSKSLTQVARIHVRDLQINRPDQGHDPRGLDCNMHSWSARGYWVPVCYTADHYYAGLMRSKPGEITQGGFDEDGYEVVYWSSKSPVVPALVAAAWLRSPAHRSMLFETGKWAGTSFKSVGVGFSENFAVLWYSPVSDLRGSLPLCNGGR
jgi:hypothetical protein